MHSREYGCDTPYGELVVSIEEVTHAIENLDLNKARESDDICSENLKYASNVLVPLLGMCFTSFISHGFLPESMLSVVLVPVIKDTYLLRHRSACSSRSIGRREASIHHGHWRSGGLHAS